MSSRVAFTVYVLRNAEGRLYIGQTSDLRRRLNEHASGASGWTSGAGRGPWQLVQAEEFETRAEAMARERQLKSGRANQELRRTSRAGDGC
ncbi:MAG: GIY-YIG nuclease family protein [Chloroflexi bacterium]|nr:GIY-YIG nuclease family protein [Chloroflexota bacterium]